MRARCAFNNGAGLLAAVREDPRPAPTRARLHAGVRGRAVPAQLNVVNTNSTGIGTHAGHVAELREDCERQEQP